MKIELLHERTSKEDAVTKYEIILCYLPKVLLKYISTFQGILIEILYS